MRTFLEIAKRGSVTQAARALKVSQPAITQQIRRLEADFGVSLLERVGDKLRLTEAGERFQRFAEKVVGDYQDLRRELLSTPSALRGSLRLGASTIPGEFVVPRILARFKELHPRVEASVAIAGTAEVVDRLINGEFEVGFIGAVVEMPNLVISKLVDDELALIVYPEHPFARRRSIRFAELVGQPLILRESGSGTMRSLQQALSERGLELPRENVVMTLGSSRAVASAVASGLGIGFVSALAVASESPGRLVVVPIEGLTVKRSLYFLYEEERARSRLPQEFIAFLEQWAADRQAGRGPWRSP